MLRKLYFENLSSDNLPNVYINDSTVYQSAIASTYNDYAYEMDLGYVFFIFEPANIRIEVTTSELIGKVELEIE